ncbi:MAG: hypothetical protein KME60_12275 [Cyanomargarita calcarea GSE-NOS-MK-12-04C]|jgi:hypothetical protein|uniref:Uncharacterized protein n=1 Tax=Cyanomargarita calcarea GSE-NOS-MK-12-04C TaxID=2839659 RepID=A0A951QLJ0_9CYAN|nr:hypothetical protein [Cyanomargarita calcarea GSE-NOS-MK-12-04C]
MRDYEARLVVWQEVSTHTTKTTQTYRVFSAAMKSVADNGGLAEKSKS